MAEKAATLVLKNLLPWLEKEIKLSGEVHREVEYMKEELERMRGTLQLADATDDVNENMKICIRQMRNVAYDTEDVLEEFMLRLARDHGDGCLGLVCKMIEFITNFKARHDIASSIKGINRRIEGISKGLQNNPFNSLDQSSSSSITASPTWHDPRGDALLLDEAELVGFEEPMKKLIGWLLEDKSERGTISVAGIGGLGKTTLVKRVYDDKQVKGHFHFHVWITVSQSFQAKRLLKDIIQQLFREIKQQDPDGLDAMDENGLKKMIKQFLQQKKYLVVFDDIWSTAAWEDLQYALPKNNCSSRIVVTTRSSDIASYCKASYGAGYVYDLQPLDRKKSWTLFCNKAFGGETCPQHLEGLSRSILKRCEGLPLAIVAIGGLLATKDNTGIDEWEMVYRSLPSELEKNDKLKSLNRVLLLSYNHLPYYLKPCFLYLSIFPEDYMIKSMRLVRLWMAEGFIEEQAGRTLEEVGANYLNELINRSLVQVAQTNIDGRIRRCRVHDLIREIILSKSKDQNMGTMIDERVTNQPERIRSLLIHKSCGNIPPTKSLSLLRSLIMMKVHTLSNCKFLGGLRLLKVLDLRGVPLETFPGEVTNLFHLRYLCLRRSKISILPNSIERLQNLETLDLKHVNVSELPMGIFKLQKLHHLLVYSYNTKSYETLETTQGLRVGREIGNLASLQKLCVIEPNNQCNDGGSVMIQELGRLSQLRKLGIQKLRRVDGKDLCCSIEKMIKLRSLSVASTEDKEVLDLQSICAPPPFLQRLNIKGRLEMLPQWISSVRNLSKIRLRWSNLRDDPLEVLEALPNLVYLGLNQAYDGELLCFKTGGFQRLKILDLDRLDRLRWVRFEKGTMPLLQKLQIRRCELLEKVPFGIEHLVKLNLLDFYDMPDEFRTGLHRDKGDDHSKISHIPHVHFSFWREGRWNTTTCCTDL